MLLTCVLKNRSSPYKNASELRTMKTRSGKPIVHKGYKHPPAVNEVPTIERSACDDEKGGSFCLFENRNIIHDKCVASILSMKPALSQNAKCVLSKWQSACSNECFFPARLACGFARPPRFKTELIKSTALGQERLVLPETTEPRASFLVAR